VKERRHHERIAPRGCVHVRVSPVATGKRHQGSCQASSRRTSLRRKSESERRSHAAWCMVPCGCKQLLFLCGDCSARRSDRTVHRGLFVRVGPSQGLASSRRAGWLYDRGPCAMGAELLQWSLGRVGRWHDDAQRGVVNNGAIPDPSGGRVFACQFTLSVLMV